MTKLATAILLSSLCLGAGACSASFAKRDATGYQTDTRAVLTARNDQVKTCYDRALARVPVGTFTCVLLYDDELLPGVPHEEHDRRVVAAVTPGGVRVFG